MSLTINTNIKNDADGYLTDAKHIRGTYVVVSTIDERDALYSSTAVAGTLCFVTENSKTYRKTLVGWVEKEDASIIVEQVITEGIEIAKINGISIYIPNNYKPSSSQETITSDDDINVDESGNISLVSGTTPTVDENGNITFSGGSTVTVDENGNITSVIIGGDD